jgi:hypothetical protein
MTDQSSSPDIIDVARKAGDEAYKRWSGGRECLDGMQFIAKAIVEAITDVQAARTLDTGIENDPCPYAQDGCVLEANEIGPCLCANHVRASGRGDAAQGKIDPTDVKWGVNVLLETIAAKFEAWETFDLFRSEAAATVRSFKHPSPISSTPSADPMTRPQREPPQ